MVRKICINGDYLGSLKQIPFLIKGIHSLKPNTEISVLLNDFIPVFQKKLQKTFFNDLKKQKINTKRVKVILPPSSFFPKIDLSIYDEVYINKIREWLFPVDPLKFERRNLLNEKEIMKLKDRYRIKDERVIVLGSVSVNETKLFLDAVRDLENSKIIFVPRADYGDYLNSIHLLGNMVESDSGKMVGKKFVFVTGKGYLDSLYSICDLAIIGNTFLDDTGQNPLEPAFYGKRIISGDKIGANLVAYIGLEQTGLLKKISRKDFNKFSIEEILQKDVSEAVKKTKTFIDSMDGVAKVYAEIILQQMDNGPVGEWALEKMNALPYYQFKRNFL